MTIVQCLAHAKRSSYGDVFPGFDKLITRIFRFEYPIYFCSQVCKNIKKYQSRSIPSFCTILIRFHHIHMPVISLLYGALEDLMDVYPPD